MVTVVISSVAFIVAMFALVVGLWALVELLAFKRSTHQIQYMPIDKAVAQGLPDSFKEDMMSRDLDSLT